MKSQEIKLAKVAFNPLKHFRKMQEIALPQFPVNSLPPVVARYVGEISTFRQTPLEMAGALAIAALAACTQKRYIIEVRKNWHEPLCTYVLVSAKPAERKSGVFSDILSPVYDFCSKHNKDNAVEFEKNAAQLEILERKINIAKKQEAECLKEKTKSNLEALLKEKTEFERKIPLKLTIEDSTPEKLVDIAATQNNALFLASPDCDLIDYVASGRYENSGGLSVYLRGYDGERVELDRITRGEQIVEKLLLSIALTVQPYVVESFFSNRKNTGRGLTARFLFAMCGSDIGNRLSNPPEITSESEESYRCLIADLLNHSIHHNGDMEKVTLSLEADKLRAEYQDKIEKRLVGDMTGFSEWGGKLVGKMLRIAGIFHIVDCI
jgi:hypothetical protein